MDVAVVAKSWIGTRFIGSMWPPIKGQGCDCGGLLAGVLLEAGLIPTLPNLGKYDFNSPWAKGDSFYADLIAEYCDQLHESRAEAGDIVLFAMGRGWGHGGIYLGEGQMVHADGSEGVCIAGTNEGRMRGRKRSFWRAKGLAILQ